MADCTKCGGSGRVEREATIAILVDGISVTVPNPEADAKQHPILSQVKPSCPRCCGGGKEPSAEDLKHMQAAAAALQS